MEIEDAGGAKRVGLVLSGGAARGFAHIGLLRVIERAGIQVDVIAGTSMGAILGAFYANGYSAEKIYELAKSISWRDIIDFSFGSGLFKGVKLHTFLAAHLPETFDEMQKPLVISTTDLETGEEAFIFQGDLVTAVRASSCFPGAFEPVSLTGARSPTAASSTTSRSTWRRFCTRTLPSPGTRRWRGGRRLRAPPTRATGGRG